MQDPIKKKIEVWINAQDHAELKQLCKGSGYTIAETMRRAAEEKIVELKKRREDA